MSGARYANDEKPPSFEDGARRRKGGGVLERAAIGVG
jgi:hypothetical protein